mmetsp:Transcript_43365/g.105091  ORF Transcript_43365/g.105091 Transcript_43365/m.105091 type:complete len:106 (+) Transcript_43365:960-1277(+)
MHDPCIMARIAKMQNVERVPSLVETSYYYAYQKKKEKNSRHGLTHSQQTTHATPTPPSRFVQFGSSTMKTMTTTKDGDDDNEEEGAKKKKKLARTFLQPTIGDRS